MSTIKNVFISGKVTGEDYQKCWDKFTAVEEMLVISGYNPVNPMKIVDKGTNWQDAMDILKPHLLNSDIILFLPDWNNSEGAICERALAINLKKRIVDYDNIIQEILEPIG